MSLLAGGCSQSLYTQGRKLAEQGNYQTAVEKYQALVQQKPNEFRGWRELGVAFYNIDNIPKAIESFQSAEKIKGDPRSRLYLGLAYEKLKDWENAKSAYNAALSLAPSDEIAKRVNSRLGFLSSREEIEKALAAEASINADSIPSNTIAVYDFDGSTLDSALAPLALGLAEFTSSDLSRIKSLTVVERAKLHLLLKEMELAKSGYVDTLQAPQVGKILGSRNIVTGRLTSPNLDHLKLSGVLVSTIDSAKAIPGGAEAILNKIFEIQKEFVRQIVKELGVELTPEELDSLDIRPTDSYEAFMAYCQGLAYQKNGQYDKAMEEFRRALHLDDGFVYANNQLDLTTNLFNQTNFENFIQDQTIGGVNDLESTLGNVLDNSGAIPNPQGGDNGQVVTNPPHVPTGSVRVKGKVDDK